VHFTLGAKLRNPSCFLLKIQACEWPLEEVGIWFPNLPKTEMHLQDLPDLTLVYFWCIILIERSINTLHLREA